MRGTPVFADAGEPPASMCRARPIVPPWLGTGVLLLGLVTVWASPVAEAQPRGEPEVLVLPLEAVGSDPSLAWLPEAVAIRLAEEVEARGLPAFDRDERLQAYRALGLPSSARLSRPSAIGIGRLLGADSVIVGTLEADDGDLVVRVQHLAADGTLRSGEMVERGAVVDTIAIVAELAERLTSSAAGGVAASAAPALPPDAFEHYVKGLIAGAPQTRLDFLRVALDRAPDSVSVRVALWAAATEAGAIEEALDAVAAIPRSDAAGPWAAVLAARSLLTLSRLDEADAMLKELQEASPDRAVWTQRALVQLARGGRPDSGRLTYVLHQAVMQDPDDPDSLFNLGYAYWLEDAPDASLYWLQETLRRRPDDAEARVLLALALERQGRAERAGIERALASCVTDVGGWASRFEALPPAGEPGPLRLPDRWLTPRQRRIAEHLRQGVRAEYRRWSRFHLDRGREASDTGRDDEAMGELARALQLQPEMAEAHLLLAGLYLRAGRLREAQQSASLSAWLGETVAARLLLAEAHARLGETEAARREAGRALQLDPADARAAALIERLGLDEPR